MSKEILNEATHGTLCGDVEVGCHAQGAVGAQVGQRVGYLGARRRLVVRRSDPGLILHQFETEGGFDGSLDGIASGSITAQVAICTLVLHCP